MPDTSFSSKLPHVPHSDSLLSILRQIFNPSKQGVIIRTTLPAGFHDITDRMLHANFQLLVDYVQRECALEEVLEFPDLHKQSAKWYWTFYMPPNEALGILFLNRIIQRAKHSQGNVDEQGHVSRERDLAQNLVYLYDWWTNVRPMQIKVINITTDVAKKKSLELALHKQDQEHLFALINLRMQPWF